MKRPPTHITVPIVILVMMVVAYMIYGISTPNDSKASTPDTVSGAVAEDTACSWFECEIDYSLATQKKLLMSKYELMVSQKELEATLNRVKQNIDINDSAIKTVQSQFNDKFKNAYYSGINAFR